MNGPVQTDRVSVIKIQWGRETPFRRGESKNPVPLPGAGEISHSPGYQVRRGHRPIGSGFLKRGTVDFWGWIFNFLRWGLSMHYRCLVASLASTQCEPGAGPLSIMTIKTVSRHC